MSRSYESVLDNIAEYLRFLSKAQSFWFTLKSSYDHGGEQWYLIAATVGNKEAAARQGQQARLWTQQSTRGDGGGNG
jgi:hypothetical protein